LTYFFTHELSANLFILNYKAVNAKVFKSRKKVEKRTATLKNRSLEPFIKFSLTCSFEFIIYYSEHLFNIREMFVTSADDKKRLWRPCDFISQGDCCA